MNSLKRSDYTKYACFVMIITGMVMASELTGENEVIFPEIAAIALGCFLAPVIPWNTDYRRMFICIAICALLGTAISVFLPLPLWAKLIIAYLVGQCVFVLSGTTFAPMISAIALPVLIGTERIVYPIAAVILTALIIALCMVFSKSGHMAPPHFSKLEVSLHDAGPAIVCRCLAILILAPALIHFGFRFCMAPPLLVAFTELCRKGHPAISRQTDVVTMTTLMALTGSLFRLILCHYLALPLTLAALCTSIALIIIVRLYKFYFPPSAAMAILALLIPEAMVISYPFQVFAGISIFVSAAAACRRYLR